MATLQEQVLIILNKIGVNKNGTLNGNGIINDIKELKTDISKIKDYINTERVEKVSVFNRLDNIEEDIVAIKSTLESIQDSLKDNINMRSFKSMRNIFVGIAAVLGAFGAIGTFLYNFLKILYEKGN